MCRQIFLTGLAMTILFTGCLVRQDQPVAQEKSVGRILDEISGKGTRGAAKLTREADKVSKLIKKSTHTALREDEIRELADAVMSGGSKGINNFKTESISKVFDEFADKSNRMGDRLTSKLDELSSQHKIEINVMIASRNFAGAVEFLKKHSSIANDKVFKELVKSYGDSLDDFAEAVADNHRLADAVAAELASDSSYGLKKLGISVEHMASELKVGLKDFNLDALIAPSGTDPAQSYKFLQELSGVDVYHEGAHLELMLRRGEDGKHVYLTLSDEQIKKLGNPFDKDFTKPVISTNYDQMSSEYLLNIYKKPAPLDPKILDQVLENVNIK